ncbi:MAG TPA: pirin family protein [Ghiorsea sp.]|nr:pirin family protein [Ghiorsea sp.]
MLDAFQVKTTVEGKSVKIKRIVPARKRNNKTPFLRIEHFNAQDGGFPNQVHHGFEGLFYLFSGKVHHEDSIGSKVDIESGGVELFTTGAGLLHAELVEHKAHGIRIWIDLPDDKKHMPPSYQRFEVGALPEESNSSISVRTIVGKGSPVKPQLNVDIFDITLSGKSAYKYNIPEKFNGFLYVVEGSIKIKGKVINASETVYFENERDIAMLSNTGARVLICFGEPHGGEVEFAQAYVVI